MFRYKSWLPFVAEALSCVHKSVVGNEDENSYAYVFLERKNNFIVVLSSSEDFFKVFLKTDSLLLIGKIKYVICIHFLERNVIKLPMSIKTWITYCNKI